MRELRHFNAVICPEEKHCVVAVEEGCLCSTSFAGFKADICTYIRKKGQEFSSKVCGVFCFVVFLM